MSYSVQQWVLLFFVYCFLGWVWESCYVSLKQREWVNRGFLYGPWLPIYGFGAIAILLATLRFQESLALVFLAGMTAASLLELFTGWLMEKLFHMRYWDYSHLPLNLNGYICLPVSFAWGGFSLLLVKIIHPFVHKIVMWVYGDWSDIVTLALMALFAVDVTRSVQAVLDMKALMQKLTQSDNTLSRITLRLSEGSDYIRQLKEHMERTARQAKENLRAADADRLTERRSRKMRTISSLLAKTEQFLEEIPQKLELAESEAERQILQKSQKSLRELHELLMKAEKELQERKNSDFRQAISILRRNPTAVSHKYPAAFSEIQSLKDHLKKKRKK